MNETHLEHPPEVQAAIAELTSAVGDLTVEQELRQFALKMAIRVYVCPRNDRYLDVIELSETFLRFLSEAGSDD
jgi:hypothetical protein